MADRLGNLEEMVLLMVVLVKEQAYGVLVREAYIEQYKQEISLSAIHTVLRRLEDKGFLVSELGGASAKRGGRRKRLYRVTAFGYQKLTEYQEERNRIWSLIPKLKF